MLPGLIQFLIFLAASTATRNADLPRQTIRVEIHADADLESLPRRLTLARACHDSGATGAAFSTRDCSRIEREFHGSATAIENVEPGRYLLGLRIGRAQRVDLVVLGTADRTETVEFTRPHLRGRVTRQGTGVAATMEFTVDQDPVADESFASDPTTVESETSGDYGARLWSGALYLARVTPKDGGGPPATFRFVAPETDDSRDFVLSNHPLHVRVRDADSGQPVDGAKIVFIGPSGLQTPRSDAEGVVEFPSVAAGKFHATVVAKGYVNKIVDVVLEDRDDTPPLDVALTPKSGGNEFQVYLPDGSPAANAFGYYRFDPVTETRIRIFCDEQGVCDPGERPGDGEWIVLAHPEAGLTLGNAAEIYASRSIILSPSGGHFAIRLKPGGGAPGNCQKAIISIGGIPVEASAFTCDGRRPIEFTGLPSGSLEVTIVGLQIDPQGRMIHRQIAGPISVRLPSEPVEVPIP